MHGYQLTFYTGQDRRHGHQSVCEWLLGEVRRLGIRGVTVVNCAEGIGHAGAHHAAHMLRLADQPVQIVMAVTEEEAERVLDIVRTANAHVFYVRVPVEFGLIGGAASHDRRRAPARDMRLEAPHATPNEPPDGPPHEPPQDPPATDARSTPARKP